MALNVSEGGTPDWQAAPWTSVDLVANLPKGKFDRARIFREILMESTSGGTKVELGLYRPLRSEFIDDVRVGHLVPDFIRDCEGPGAFWDFIRDNSRRVEERRRLIWRAFEPILRALSEGADPAKPLTADEKAALLSDEKKQRDRGSVQSSTWTGTRTVREQRNIVLQMAPQALNALEALLEEQEFRLHNGPPETVDVAALAALRDLHSALTELLTLADREAPIKAATKRVARLLTQAFSIAKETGELLVGGLPTIAASTVTGWGTFAMCHWIVGLDGAASSTMGGAAVAATIVGTRRPKSGRGSRQPSARRGSTK